MPSHYNSQIESSFNPNAASLNFNPTAVPDFSSSTSAGFEFALDPIALALPSYTDEFGAYTGSFTPQGTSSLADPFSTSAISGLPSLETSAIDLGPTIEGAEVLTDKARGRQETRLYKVLADKAEREAALKWWQDPLLAVFAAQLGLGFILSERQTEAQKKENQKDREFQARESALAHERALEQIEAGDRGGGAADTSEAFNLFRDRLG